MARAAPAAGLFRFNPITLFAAGFVSVLVFQMGAGAIMHALGYVPNPPFPYRATTPFGVPQTWSLAFWGGVWGLVFGLLEKRFPGGVFYYVAAFLFGAVLPILVLWFVVFPLRGQPIAAGWNVTRMITQVLSHGAYGLGVAILLRWRG
jgi:hypothetical protein